MRLSITTLQVFCEDEMRESVKSARMDPCGDWIHVNPCTWLFERFLHTCSRGTKGSMTLNLDKFSFFDGTCFLFALNFSIFAISKARLMTELKILSHVVWLAGSNELGEGRSISSISISGNVWGWEEVISSGPSLINKVMVWDCVGVDFSAFSLLPKAPGFPGYFKNRAGIKR